MAQVVLVTGASSGFGRMVADALADAGHVVYASMRDLSGRNAHRSSEIGACSRERGVDLRALELDVQSERSVAAAVEAIVAEHGRLDVLVHNAEHMVYGPSGAFTPERLAELYDVNVLGCQRVNRLALPHMRRAGRGLLVWIGSSSTAGGVPPLPGPYLAAKAGMDVLAVACARELAPPGIESSIVVLGACTTGTSHFANAGAPAEVARVVAGIVDAPRGRRPFRVVVDPADDGAAVSYAVIDRVREQFLDRIGFAGLRHPAGSTGYGWIGRGSCADPVCRIRGIRQECCGRPSVTCRTACGSWRRSAGCC